MSRESKIDWLKRQAKKRKSPELIHSHALHQIAVEIGARKWADVLQLDEEQLSEAIRVYKERNP